MEGTVMLQTTTEAIRSFITENFLFDDPCVVLADDASLLELGIIDSTGILSLLMFAEEAFGIAIPDVDVTTEHFDSIRSLASYVSARLVAEQIPA